MRKWLEMTCMMAAFFSLNGCSQVSHLKQAMSKFIHQEQVKTAGLFSSDSSVSDEISWTENDEDAAPTMVVHFAYDQSQLTPNSKQQLAKLADRLKAHRDMNIQIAGHTDERGSREYNLSLGWRRARAVERYLTQLGVNFSQLDMMSYGKEKPVDLHHSPQAWAHNRRVSLIDVASHVR